MLAVHFSASVEKTTEGFHLTLADQEAIASGQKVTLISGEGDRVTLELIADFHGRVETAATVNDVIA